MTAADAPDKQRRVAIETQVTGASQVATAASRITMPSTLTAPFAAYIAHELRTPLATQRALLELALADRHTDASAWREIARKALDACMQQERLLEACLVLTRSEAGLDRRELVDIAALTARLLRIADPDGLTVKVRLEPALTIGDEALIERLLDNVVANAIRHNRAGGWIAITAGCSRSQTLFTIENTGDSIPADELTRLFQPFEQRRWPKGRPATGFGLGLAIVKAIADAHCASITARARPNGGLRVEFAFPPATQPRGDTALSRTA